MLKREISRQWKNVKKKDIKNIVEILIPDLKINLSN